ncbi:uncharacterized protein LOC143239966 isoform X2 [Tachypleus tridentatus]|uniref:uncharacterized protein LOC143239966 isoform X2 n=1 Tax=Tachypleus tridentatus TaxID=6853 RepID=UPI003FD3055F
MALVTVQRSPSSQAQSRCGETSESEKGDETDEPDGTRDRKETAGKVLERSLSECYFVVKGAAVILPHDECLHLYHRSFSNGAGDLQKHLQAMLYLLCPDDTLKIAVKLESVHVGRTRYLVVVSCQGRNGSEESCLLGVDCHDSITIGLVLPIWADTDITLDGDGGFSLSTSGKKHIFKPVSVQAMWSALQTLHKASAKARDCNSYMCGGSHQWINYYEYRIKSDQSCLNEWNAMDDLESRRPPSPDSVISTPTEREETQKVIRAKLKEVMMSVDLEEVTSKYIRTRLEEEMNMNLNEYKWYLDQEMLTILGQMDAPTEIFEYLYLGSEWNASNLEELKDKGILHILNVTREIDNFFPGMFNYYNIRVYDDESTDLLPHWDNTYKYIRKANKQRHSSLWRSKSENNLNSPDQSCRTRTELNSTMMKSPGNIDLTIKVPGISFRPKSWSPSDSLAQELLTLGIENEEGHQTKRIKLGIRQRSVTDPSCYPDFGVCHNYWLLGNGSSDSFTVLQDTPRSCLDNIQMTKGLSIQHRITELESQITSNEIQKSSKVDLTNRSGLVQNLATQFETGSVMETVPCIDVDNVFSGSAIQVSKSQSNESVLFHAKPPIPRIQPTFSKYELPNLSKDNGLVRGGGIRGKKVGRPRSVSAIEVHEQCKELFRVPVSPYDGVLRKQKVGSKSEAALFVENNKSEANPSVSTEASHSSKVINQQEKVVFQRERSSSNSSISQNSPAVPKKLSKDALFFRPIEPAAAAELSTPNKSLSTETNSAVPYKNRFSYEKESIPWTPGTVKRTKQQIEEKRASFCCENYLMFSNSHSTPSTPPELGSDCEGGLRKNIQRSRSLRCDKRPLSAMFPIKWFPLPALAAHGPAPPVSHRKRHDCLDFGFSEERTDMSHSASMPSMVEAVNKVLCGTQEVLNSAIQSASSESSRSTTPKLQPRPESDNVVFSSDIGVTALSPSTALDTCKDKPTQGTVRLQRDQLETLNLQKSASRKCNSGVVQEKVKTKRSKIKEYGQILVPNDNITEMDDGGKGVVRKLTKELEAKSGQDLSQRVVILGKDGKEQIFESRPWRNNSSPSLSNLDTSNRSTCQDTFKDTKSGHVQKFRALSDVSQETVFVSGHLAFQMDPTDKSESIFMNNSSPSLSNLTQRKCLAALATNDKENLHGSTEIRRKGIIGLTNNGIPKDVICCQSHRQLFRTQSNENISHSDLQHIGPHSSQKKFSLLSEGTLIKTKRLQGNSQSLNWFNRFSKTV